MPEQTYDNDFSMQPNKPDLSEAQSQFQANLYSLTDKFT